MNGEICTFAIRIAVQQILRKARRSVAALLGIAGGVVLVLVQLGFQSAVYDSSVRLHRSFAGELVVAPATFRSLVNGAWFPANRLDSVQSHAGVASVAPLYWSHAPLGNVDDSTPRKILLIGIDVDRPAIDLGAIGADVRSLQATGRALFDAKSLPLFGNVAGQVRQSGQSEVAMPLAGSPLHPGATVIGTYILGGTATIAGTMLTGAATFADITGQPHNRVNLGIVKLKDGSDPARVARDLALTLPVDVTVYTKSEIVAIERGFWKSESPIGFLFDLGTLIGFVISGVYISQVLFQTVDENLSQYAVLKSMGYPPEFFVVLVATTALILVAAALPVGFAVADVVYRICMHATLLDIHSTAARAALVAAVTAMLALAVAVLASRRLNRADPAALL